MDKIAVGFCLRTCICVCVDVWAGSSNMNMAGF